MPENLSSHTSNAFENAGVGTPLGRGNTKPLVRVPPAAWFCKEMINLEFEDSIS